MEDQLDSGSLAELVAGAVRWIDSVAVEADGGAIWTERGEPFDDLYAGTAGILYAAAEIAAAGLDPEPVAARARARALWLADAPGEFTATLPDDGLFTGWSGVAVALRAWARASADDEADAAAERVERAIAMRVLSTELRRDRYTDVISGDAGILLALTPAIAGNARPGPQGEACDALADRLVAVAEPVEAGLQWQMVEGWEYLMPGFSHGTAGVGYALAAAGRALGRSDLIEVAVAGASALLEVGDTPDGWALPLAIPPRPHGPPVNFGWCHGPSGTIRLFQLLDDVAPDPRWRHAVEACLTALEVSRIPQRLYPGYWDNVARCCGTAGVGSMLVGQFGRSGEPSTLAFADRLAADVAGRTLRGADGPSTARWSNFEYTAGPGDLPPEPGLMQGAAGIAGWFARAHAARQQRPAQPGLTGLEPDWI